MAPPPTPHFSPEDEAPIDIEKLNRLDTDGDGIPDGEDNCPNKPNSTQADKDGDGFGDICEPQPLRVDTATRLTITPSPAHLNQPLTVTMRVRNTGTAGASSIVGSIPLPNALDPHSVTSSQGTCKRSREGSILCKLGNLAPEQELMVTVRCLPRAIGNLTIRAFAMSEILDRDANSDNDDPTTRLTVLP
ncbi:thrombospondin type 3 repeat-containing protein [Myxococcus stipitatus]|uniref:thrombospondin type 3 repeat-containing protein n=1 Tax=Myxococcus stipitatus TaxID=83455 RepID=UPI00314547C9